MAGENLMQAPAFVEVILPLALTELYTYSLPAEFAQEVAIGQRVIVQFGKNKVYTALVHRMHSEAPGFPVKAIIGLVDQSPVVSEFQFAFWKWISDYYLCTMGEVMSAALPSALRLESETLLLRSDTFDGDTSVLNDREYLVWEALELQPELSIAEVTKILSIRQVMPVIKSMLSKGALVVREELIEKVHPRIHTLVSLAEQAKDEAWLSKGMDQLEKRAPKQLELLMHFLRMSRESANMRLNRQELLKKSGLPSTVLTQLVKKGFLELTVEKAGFESEASELMDDPNELNNWQIQALKEVHYAFDEKKVCLLHGVTSSGKTEVYIHLIDEQLKLGKQVLYLLPEIALTTQIISRLRRHFGDRLLIYHSRFNDQEKVKAWNRILDSNLKSGTDDGLVIVGARSAIFLPLAKLGLVIVDEEHDFSYKQENPSPRYHARDAAVVLAAKQDAHVLLGTATPALETYYNALSGKYALVTLDKRHADLRMPEVALIDMAEARKRKLVTGNFSHVLIDRIAMTVAEGNQVILFQNRRGFAPFFECAKCSWVPVCIHCDVALTYHKRRHVMNCHYCGYTSPVPNRCSACGDQDLLMKGYGTERLEEELQSILPDLRIERLDLDTTRSKHAFSRILGEFGDGNIDVLIGTQMITKGLDFDRVSLVGILSADGLFHFPEFRAHERGFQLLSQVSGRAGRKEENGLVMIQTYQPEHPVLRFVLKHDYKGFYEKELIERHRFAYPPYVRLIELRLRHRDEQVVDQASLRLAKYLREVFGARVAGPSQPDIARVRNLYIRHLMIKAEKTLSIQEVKRMLMKALTQFRAIPENRQLQLQIDVDPL